MQLELLHQSMTAQAQTTTSIQQLQQLSHQAKGWIVIFSDQKINKQSVEELGINPSCVLQLNSELLTSPSISKLSEHTSCIIMTESLCDHPMAQSLIDYCHRECIHFLKAKVEAHPDKKIPVNAKRKQKEQRQRQYQLTALKRELLEIVDAFTQDLQACA